MRSITPEALHALMAAGPVELIDVRTGLEWAGGRAAGARHVPLSSLDPARVMATRQGKADDPLYLICASGGRSASACAAFERAGFTQVVNVEGGTGAWKRAGLPLQRDPAGAGLGLVRQLAIYALVGGTVLFLMPCSPFSLWGSAYCPVTPPAASATAPAPRTPSSGDFAREVVAASAVGPVLVDFHAGWCPPCRKLGPEIDALAAERGDRLRVVKIDVDAQPQVAQAQGVSGIPDVRLWQGGREVARFAGYRSQAEIAAWLDQALAGGSARVD